MQAELIFTGTELLIGHVVNTHGQYLGQKLSALGIEVTTHTLVGDNSNNLKQVFKQALERSDLIITTGGLGSTTDDVTKETFAELMGIEMLLDEKALHHIQEFCKNSGSEMVDNIIKQAYVPAGSKVLPNPNGTAPGIFFEHNNRFIFMLPGPPWEMRAIFEKLIEPFLVSLERKGKVTLSKTFKLTGISESVVQDRLASLGGQGNPGLAYTVKPGEVHVRVIAQAEDRALAKQMMDELADKVRCRMAGCIFGVDDEVLEETVGKLLLEKGVTISLAESCTGGLLAQRITDVPGSSRYFMGGIVAYDNTIKTKLLNVSPKTLEHYGAVSKETAVEMAQGIRRLMGSILGLAITGIAGPSGGSPEKPLGLVYIALAAPDGTCCRKFKKFPGMRSAIRQGAANAGLNMIRLYLLAQ